MIPARRFPTGAEVDAWIEAHIGDDDPRDPAGWDQKVAATKENTAAFEAMAIHGVARGQFRMAVLDHGPNRDGDEYRVHVRRAAVRAYLAAASAGITPMCPHTDQIRPLVIQCDPPVIACRSCLPGLMPRLKRLGFHWDHICDRCGGPAPTVAPSGLTLGHITLIAHICQACRDSDDAASIQLAGEIVKVGRNQPCLCGSGLKYKRCHGKPGSRS
jgi:hypothetical protein